MNKFAKAPKRAQDPNFRVFGAKNTFRARGSKNESPKSYKKGVYNKKNFNRQE